MHEADLASLIHEEGSGDYRGSDGEYTSPLVYLNVSKGTVAMIFIL